MRVVLRHEAHRHEDAEALRSMQKVGQMDNPWLTGQGNQGPAGFVALGIDGRRPLAHVP
jgi:hypothetical protein